LATALELATLATAWATPNVVDAALGRAPAAGVSQHALLVIVLLEKGPDLGYLPAQQETLDILLGLLVGEEAKEMHEPTLPSFLRRKLVRIQLEGKAELARVGVKGGGDGIALVGHGLQPPHRCGCTVVGADVLLQGVEDLHAISKSTFANRDQGVIPFYPVSHLFLLDEEMAEKVTHLPSGALLVLDVRG
jgi:hypothetical protein